MKTNIIISFIFVYVFLFASQINACVGARPLGMGGAFVAVADDINSVYWNPAGLANIKNKVLTLTLDTDKYDDGTWKYSYPYFFAAGIGNDKNCWAISYIKVSEDVENPYRGKALLYAAYGQRMDDKLSLGFEAGVRDVNDPSFDLSVTPEAYVTHIPIFYALGMLYKFNDYIDLGLLIQAPINFRPGIAFKLTDRLILSYDIYDAFNTMGLLMNMWGIEYRVLDYLSLRVGRYDVYYTLGFGVNYDYLSLDWFSWQEEENTNQMWHHGVALTVNF